MNHDEIYNEQLLDLYLMGRLEGSRQEELEEHFIDCAQCIDELEVRRAFIAGVRQLPSNAFGPARDFRNWRALALAASVLLAITGPLSVWSVYQMSTTPRNLDEPAMADTEFVVMPLVSTRGGGSGDAANVVELGTRPRWFVFELEGDYLPGTAYAVSIGSDKSQSVSSQSVVADNRGVLVAGITSTALDAGSYTIAVSAPDQSEASRRFELRVVGVGESL